MQFFKTLKNIIPFLLPFLIPFSRSVADICVVLIAVLFLFKSYFENEWNWIKEGWFKFALIFFLYCIFINTPLSIDPFESLQYSIFFLRWPIFALAIGYWILNDIRSLKNFLVVTFFVSLFLIFDTWYQYIIGVDIFGLEKPYSYRLSGPFSGPHIGMWLTKLIILPIFLLTIIKKYKNFLNNRFSSLTFFIFFAIFFSTIFITGERMALLMTILSIFTILLGLIMSKNIKISIMILFIFFVLIVSYFFSIIDPKQTHRAIYSSIETILNLPNSAYGIIWKSAFNVWMESPWFGVGLHKFREACGSLGIYGTLDEAMKAGFCYHPHNISFQLLSETGLLGFILFFTMVASLSIRLLRDSFVKKDWLLFFLILNVLFACFLPIQSNTDFFSNKYSSLVWLLVGVSFGICRYIESIKKSSYLHQS
jgi:O-antigen ligase